MLHNYGQDTRQCEACRRHALLIAQRVLNLCAQPGQNKRECLEWGAGVVARYGRAMHPERRRSARQPQEVGSALDH